MLLKWLLKGKTRDEARSDMGGYRPVISIITA